MAFEEVVEIVPRIDLQNEHFCSDDDDDDEEEEDDLTLEGTFQKAGQFGWFQKRFFLIKILYQFPAAFNTLAIAFIGLTPQRECLEHHSNSFLNDTSNDSCSLLDSANCTDHFYSIAQEVKTVRRH